MSNLKIRASTILCEANGRERCSKCQGLHKTENCSKIGKVENKRIMTNDQKKPKQEKKFLKSFHESKKRVGENKNLFESEIIVLRAKLEAKRNEVFGLQASAKRKNGDLQKLKETIKTLRQSAANATRNETTRTEEEKTKTAAETAKKEVFCICTDEPLIPRVVIQTKAYITAREAMSICKTCGREQSRRPIKIVEIGDNQQEIEIEDLNTRDIDLETLLPGGEFERKTHRKWNEKEKPIDTNEEEEDENMFEDLEL